MQIDGRHPRCALPCFQAGQVEQLPGQACTALRAGREPIERFAPLGRRARAQCHLRLHQQRGERRAQLVRGFRNESTFRLHGRRAIARGHG
ncbi:hypothetical protein LJR230_001396 [Trinickia sp. LjRoot230]